MIDEYEGLPKPGTRVRVEFMGRHYEGLVLAVTHLSSGSRSRVRLWTKDLDGTEVPFVQMFYRADEMEIISAAV